MTTTPATTTIVPDLSVPEDLAEYYHKVPQKECARLLAQYWTEHDDGTAEGAAAHLHTWRLERARVLADAAPANQRLAELLKAPYVCPVCEGMRQPLTKACVDCTLIADQLRARQLMADADRVRRVALLFKLGDDGVHDHDTAAAAVKG